MPDLLHQQERDRLLAALRALLRPALLDGRALTGVARAAPPGAPLLTRDNARVAELMAAPALRAADPGLADAALDFVAAMAEDAAPPPRGLRPPGASGASGVEIRRADPGDLHVVTPWHEFTGDLARGALRQRLRGADRAEDVLHTGNMVRLRLRGGVTGLLGRLGLRARTLDVEEAVTASGITPEGDGAVMWHESALRLAPLPGLTIPAGTLRYEYRVTAADPLLRLTVTLRAGPRAGLSGVRLTTALDALSEGRGRFAGLAAGRAGALAHRPAGPFAAEETFSAGPTESLHLWQDGSPEAPALHLRPHAPEAVFSARGHARDGALHWVVLRHAVPDLPRGGTATVREDRLLVAASGAPEAALRALHDPGALGGREPGGAASGPVMAALAAALLHAPAYDPPLPRDRLARLRDALDRQFDTLPGTTPGAVPAEGGPGLPLPERAPVALALDALCRADGLSRDRRRLGAVLAALAAAATPEGVIGEDLGGHGEAILALARGTAIVPDPTAAAALHRAVLALGTEPLSLGGRPLDAVPSTPALAALLRGLRALEALDGTGAAPPAEVLARAASVRDLLLGLLADRLRPDGDRLQVLPGDGGEADAASAAALLLAVLSPDEAAVAAGRVAA